MHLQFSLVSATVLDCTVKSLPARRAFGSHYQQSHVVRLSCTLSFSSYVYITETAVPLRFLSFCGKIQIQIKCESRAN